jgi:hypothetical protein
MMPPIFYAAPGDQTAAMQAYLDSLLPGDLATFRASGGNNRITLYKPVTSLGQFSYDFTGVEVYASFALTGTDPMLTVGGPLGSPPLGNVSLIGGQFTGNLCFQNLSNCKRIMPDSACTITLQGDYGCLYNDITTGALSGAAGNGSALIFNHLSKTACFNANTFRGISMHATGAAPVIWQAVQGSVDFDPSVLRFRDCFFEDYDTQTLLNVGSQCSAVFDTCYAEGPWQPGTGGGIEAFTMENIPRAWSGFLQDARFIETGVMQ